ncbi:Clp1 [Coprinopsis cinerea okayama7|uniref:Clp1 n=1 Tax=Coprinopsis cinerea (strain Okayama-7 / 130 / ATCC MYA-4618 / FGSC 9003) TaxID=240176 RepID=D6RN54_COPC7|nr:Clp1 [Coprinopsis cinerea okayama7\|eukprot:XP_002911009.1 Clp1 [Coprinopsis cinerea okayama7\
MPVLRQHVQARRADAENMPPAPAVKGVAANRLRSSLHDASRRRRGRATNTPRNSKQLVEQAKRRDVMKPKSTSTGSLKFTITSPPSTDVQMSDAAPSTSTPLTIPISLPKELARPQFKEVPREALMAVNPELADTDPEYIRQVLESHGPHFVLAAHCSNLSPFPPAATIPSAPASSDDKVRLPVRSLCLPSPENYAPLAAYLYHKQTTTLLNAMLPSPVPHNFEIEQKHGATVDSFATRLGRTYTFEKLLLNTMMIHGLWQNACALGIHDQLLWDTIDLAWQVMLTALAVSTGKPSLMISSVSTD